MTIRFLQVNAQRSLNVAHEVRKMVSENRIDVATIQEPYLYKGQVKGYAPMSAKIVQNHKDQETKAAIIIYNDSITVTQLEQFKNEHIVCAHLKTKEGSFYIVLIYCQFSYKIKGFLTKLQEIIRKLGENKIIITGDFKSVLWYNKETDEKGEKLEEFVSENDLIIINKEGNPSTFWTVNGSSNIDITLTTKDMRHSIETWQVKDNWTNSDHSCIYFETNNQNKNKRAKGTTNRYNIKSADWNKFKKLMQEKFDDEIVKRMEDMTPEDCSEFFVKTIHKICKKCIKYKRKIERKVPWWNSEIENKRREVNKCKKRIKTLKRFNRIEEENREEEKYKKIKKEYNL